MADIAAVFHWTPDAMASMSVSEIISWRALAVDRWNKMNAAPDKRGRT